MWPTNRRRPFSNGKARISVLGWVYLDLRIIVPLQMFFHFQNESANLTTQWTATLKIPYDHHYYHTESTANTCNEPKQCLIVVGFVYITSSHITQRTPTAYFLAAAPTSSWLHLCCRRWTSGSTRNLPRPNITRRWILQVHRRVRIIQRRRWETRRERYFGLRAFSKLLVIRLR